MKTRAIIERAKDGTFSIFTPDLKSGVIGLGETVEAAKRDFANSVKELQELFAEDGIEDNELNGIEFEYVWDIASVLHHFDWINLTKFASRHGFNASLLHQYKANAYISDEQAHRVLDALHRDAREMLAVNVKDRASVQSVASNLHGETFGGAAME